MAAVCYANPRTVGYGGLRVRTVTGALAMGVGMIAVTAETSKMQVKCEINAAKYRGVFEHDRRPSGMRLAGDAHRRTCRFTSRRRGHRTSNPSPGRTCTRSDSARNTTASLARPALMSSARRKLQGRRYPRAAGRLQGAHCRLNRQGAEDCLRPPGNIYSHEDQGFSDSFDIRGVTD